MIVDTESDTASILTVVTPTYSYSDSSLSSSFQTDSLVHTAGVVFAIPVFITTLINFEPLYALGLIAAALSIIFYSLSLRDKLQNSSQSFYYSDRPFSLSQASLACLFFLVSLWTVALGFSISSLLPLQPKSSCTIDQILPMAIRVILALFALIELIFSSLILRITVEERWVWRESYGIRRKLDWAAE